jgi:hypothetical protein
MSVVGIQLPLLLNTTLEIRQDEGYVCQSGPLCPPPPRISVPSEWKVCGLRSGLFGEKQSLTHAGNRTRIPRSLNW